MANFEVVCGNFSSSINLFFLKRVLLLTPSNVCVSLFVFSGCFIRCWTMSLADGKLGSGLRICRNCPYQTTKRPKSNFGQSRSFIQFVLFWTCTYVFWPWTGQFLNFTINLPINIGPTTHFHTILYYLDSPELGFEWWHNTKYRIDMKKILNFSSVSLIRIN